MLDALGRLLDQTPLHELSVEDILVEADTSRATFYAHFATKFAVATALFDQVFDEISTTMSPFVDRPDGAPVLDALRMSIDDCTTVWFRHRSILQTIVQNADSVPQFAEPLSQIKRATARAIAAEIERERRAGLAPAGHDAGELSAALVECTVQLMHRASFDEPAPVPSPSTVAQILMTIFCGTIYRIPPP